MSDSDSYSSESSSDVETVAVSKSCKLQLVNNRVKLYQKFTNSDWKQLSINIVGKNPSVEAHLYYNKINGGGNGIWDNPKRATPDLSASDINKNSKDVVFTLSKFELALQQFNKESETIRNPFPVSDCSEPCPRDSCGSMRTLVYKKQTRSADEATTTFIFCGECGKTSRS